VPVTGRSDNIRLVLCLTGGACNDAEAGKTVYRELHERVEVISVLMDPDETAKGYVGHTFRKDRIACCGSEELPGKLGNILRALRAA